MYRSAGDVRGLRRRARRDRRGGDHRPRAGEPVHERAAGAADPRDREAIAASPGIRVYACNVATQAGETEGIDLADHVDAVLGHMRQRTSSISCVANDQFNGEDKPWPDDAVEPRWPPAVDPVPHLVTDGVASLEDPHHHDPDRLAAAILRAVEREGPGARRDAGDSIRERRRSTRPPGA